MPRPKKTRNIRVLKEDISFKSYDENVTEFVDIFKDEFEVMRYIDLDNYDQSKTAEKLGISRGTVQRLLYSGRKKLIFALLNKKNILIKKWIN